eukprot:jgi/Tetstr1/441764/TSEL_003128.t1
MPARRAAEGSAWGGAGAPGEGAVAASTRPSSTPNGASRPLASSRPLQPSSARQQAWQWQQPARRSGLARSSSIRTASPGHGRSTGRASPPRSSSAAAARLGSRGNGAAAAAPPQSPPPRLAQARWGRPPIADAAHLPTLTSPAERSDSGQLAHAILDAALTSAGLQAPVPTSHQLMPGWAAPRSAPAPASAWQRPISRGAPPT